MIHNSDKPKAFEEPIEETLARWLSESTDLDKQGAYDWLCKRLNAGRVLEIGCGFGHSTAALNRHGKVVFSLDNRMDCLEAAREKVPEATFGLADIGRVNEFLIQDLIEFAPEAMVVWIGGAPADSLPKNIPPQYAVTHYRLSFQHAAVSLAGQVESIRTVHLADRTAFPWAMKDMGRKTMAQLITNSVIGNSPFRVDQSNVQFRKLSLPDTINHHAMLGGIVPVLGEATLERVSQITTFPISGLSRTV